ncbi:hypothetical protein HY994_01655 [Candidatus Micrarchaeota archaeon]|nr:hypothetical protein [Candidatus Micrarchaeota archaeon]
MLETSTAKARRVVQILNRAEVRRNPPYRRDDLLKRIESTIREDRPILLAGFWGGHKEAHPHEADRNDVAALDLLKKTADLVGAIHPVQVQLIFSDVHSALNSVPPSTIRDYRSEIRKQALERGFQITDLSQLYRMWQPKSRSSQQAATCFIREHRNQAEELMRQDVSLSTRLETAASRRKLFVVHWLGAHFETVPAHAVAHSALEYAALRLAEKKHLVHFVQSQKPVFFAYGHPDLQPILPDAPTVYWYSTRKGQGETPWFMAPAKLD